MCVAWVLLDIAKKGRACLSFFYMPTCPHCGELEPVYEDVATKLSALNKKRPAGSEEVVMIRMNTVRNDVAHFQVCPIESPSRATHAAPASSHTALLFVALHAARRTFRSSPDPTQLSTGFQLMTKRMLVWSVTAVNSPIQPGSGSTWLRRSIGFLA